MKAGLVVVVVIAIVVVGGWLYWDATHVDIRWHAANQEPLHITWQMGDDYVPKKSLTEIHYSKSELDTITTGWQSRYQRSIDRVERGLADEGILHSWNQEIDNVRTAFDRWTKENPWMTFTEGPPNGRDPHLVIVNVVVNCPMFNTACEDGLGAACVDCLNNNPYILMRVSANELNGRIYTDTVAHEFGHVLGLDHYRAHGHLMYSGVDEAPDGSAGSAYDDMGLEIPRPLAPGRGH